MIRKEFLPIAANFFSCLIPRDISLLNKMEAQRTDVNTQLTSNVGTREQQLYICGGRVFSASFLKTYACATQSFCNLRMQLRD